MPRTLPRTLLFVHCLLFILQISRHTCQRRTLSRRRLRITWHTPSHSHSHALTQYTTMMSYLWREKVSSSKVKAHISSSNFHNMLCANGSVQKFINIGSKQSIKFVYRKGTKFRGDKFARFLKNLCLKNIQGFFIFVFAMKWCAMAGDLLMFAIREYHRKIRKLISLEISYPYGISLLVGIYESKAIAPHS